MEQATINLGGIIGQFSAFYLPLVEQKQDAVDSNAGLGAIPSLPAFVDDVAADWEAAVAARATWTQTKADNDAIIAQNTGLILEKGRQIIAYLPANTWVRIDLDASGATDYYWVGWHTRSASPGYLPFLQYLHQDAQPSTPLTDNMED